MDEIILKIGDNDYNIKYSKSNYANVSVNDKIYSIELLKRFGDNVFSFAINQRLYQVELEFDIDDNLNISIDGFHFEVAITNSTKQLLEKFIQAGTNMAKGASIVKAPMPGMIIKTFVKAGDAVMAGDKLLVVEAMKMENILKAPISGVISDLRAKEGTPVNKDEFLLEIKPEILESKD